MKLLTKAGAIIDGTNRALTALAGVIVVFIMLLVSTDVIMRYALNRPLGFIVHEGTEHLLLYLIFLSAAWMLKKDRHVKMDIVLDRLNIKNQALVNVITSMLSVMVCLVLTWYGAKVTWDNFQSGTVFSFIVNIPIAPVIIIMPIGFFLLAIEFLRKSYGYLANWMSLRSQEQKS